MNIDPQRPAPTPTSGPADERRSPLRPPLVWVLLAVALLAVLLQLRERAAAKKALSVPVPADLARLDPQLRAYISNYVQGVQAASTDPMRQATLGMVYVANTLWAEARLCFSNVVRLRPDHPLGQMYLALATRELGDQTAALEAFRTLTTRFPDFAPGFFRLGETALRAGAAEESARAYERLSQLLPQEWRGPAGLGEALLAQGRAAEALPHLEKAVALAPEERIPRHLLGTAYRALGRLDEAARELSLGQNALHYPLADEWLENATRHIKALPDQFELARHLAASGQAPQAVALLEEALYWHPDDVSVHIQLAMACLAAQVPERARDLLVRALELDPKNLDAMVILADCHLELDAPDEALKLADRALEAAPAAPQSFLARGNVFLATQRGEEALAAFQRAHDLDPRNPTILVDIGDVLLRMLNRPEEALARYRQAIGLDRGLVAAQVRMADVLLRLEQLDAARLAIDEVKRLIPEDPVVNVLESRLASLLKP